MTISIYIETAIVNVDKRFSELHSLHESWCITMEKIIIYIALTHILGFPVYNNIYGIYSPPFVTIKYLEL